MKLPNTDLSPVAESLAPKVASAAKATPQADAVRPQSRLSTADSAAPARTARADAKGTEDLVKARRRLQDGEDLGEVETSGLTSDNLAAQSDEQALDLEHMPAGMSDSSAAALIDSSYAQPSTLLAQAGSSAAGSAGTASGAASAGGAASGTVIGSSGMLAALNTAPAGTVVVLDACCHNPTGYDLTPAQWADVVNTVKARGLVAFLDMAYQGFGEGIAQDGAVVGQFMAAGLDFFVSTSFSKSFSMYGERVGALSVVCESKEEAGRVLSQLKIVIRTNYSNPPTFGAQVVATVLNTPELRLLWEDELAGMRVRIKAMREQLVTKLQAAGVQGDLSFITRQKGMFSYSGLNKPQMERLRGEFGVYGVDSGRICVAALNAKNIDAVASAIAKVI